MNFERKIYDLSYKDLAFDTTIIESLMGYKPGETDPVFLKQVHEIDAHIEHACDIRAEIRIYKNIEIPADGITLKIENTNFRPGKIICRQLKRSENIAIGLCTAGNEISAWIREENLKGDLLKAYIIDLFGSEIVDAALDLVQADLETELEKEGLKLTNRYSPGYCGWDTIEQHKLFSLFQGNYPGIELTSSALMTPVKSVSCILGIGPEVRYNPYTCGICDFKDCIYRERKDRRKKKSGSRS